MIGICCPDGESGLVLAKLGESPVAAAVAARLFLGMYGVYVVCGIVEGCRGGGKTGPERGGGVGGGSAVSGLVVMDGVCGGDTRFVVELAGLMEEGEREPLLIGKRSG